MEALINILNELTPYILCGLMIIIILLFIIVIVLIKDINKLEAKYRKLMKGTSNKNLEEMLVEKIDSIEDNKKIAEDALEECKKLDKKIEKCVQKVSIVRYKAFENVGSDLSFSIALLDNENDGIILTGIYGRQDSTTYAKPVDKGISRYDLSEEELYVLNEAMKKETDVNK